MQSKATTVAAYLASLPADRRAALEAVRAVVRENLDADFEEGMQYGMIGWYVPHRVFPAGYHCDPKQPLPFAALGSQKGHMSLHIMGLYVGGDAKLVSWFQDAWTKTGRKLDMGKACVRFKKIEDVPLEVVGEVIRRLPAKEYIARYTAVLADPQAARAKQAAAKDVTARPAKKVVAKSAVSRKATTKKPASKRKTAPEA